MCYIPGLNIIKPGTYSGPNIVENTLISLALIAGISAAKKSKSKAYILSDSRRLNASFHVFPKRKKD